MRNQKENRKNPIVWVLAGVVVFLTVLLIGLVAVLIAGKQKNRISEPVAKTESMNSGSEASESEFLQDFSEEVQEKSGEQVSESTSGSASGAEESEPVEAALEEATKEAAGSHEPVIGIAWRGDFVGAEPTNVITALNEIGVEPVLLGQALDYDLSYTDHELDSIYMDEHGMLNLEASELVKSNTWHNSNVEEVLRGVDAVIFAGGQDISPNLYKRVVPWHGIEDEADYFAARDVSDYLLMSYCIDQDLPMVGICRGMQMLCVISGTDMIQDIETYYREQGVTYGYDHRQYKETKDANIDFAKHDVTITDQDSILYRAIGTDVIQNTPSWHHQTPVNFAGTPLKITGVTNSNGIEIAEAVERTDQTYCYGVQFHLEAAVFKYVSKAENASEYTDYETALAIYRDLLATLA